MSEPRSTCSHHDAMVADIKEHRHDLKSILELQGITNTRLTVIELKLATSGSVLHTLLPTVWMLMGCGVMYIVTRIG